MEVKHGGNLFEIERHYGYKKEEILDFSGNINPLGVSKKAKDFMRENLDLVSIYPDPEYKALSKAICTYSDGREDDLFLGNGATSLISGFIRAVNPKKAMIISPAYSEYKEQLQKIGSDINYYLLSAKNDFFLDLNNLVDEINKNKIELLVICNPNNPTGKTLTKDEIEFLLKSTSCYIMVDETYVEFTDTITYSSVPLTKNYPLLMVIRGTSKFFGIPGLRLGYGFCSEKKIRTTLEEDGNLWDVNIVATTMGEIMFKDEDFIKNSKNLISNERDYLSSELSSLAGVKVYPTCGNFILSQIISGDITANIICQEAIKEKMLVRNASSFEGFDNTFFRVCILSPEANRKLISKLKEIFSRS